MDLINEIMNGWEADELEKLLDEVEASYKDLVQYTSLFEGVLDELPDDVIQKVAEIEKRLDAVARARVLLTKLKKSGGYTPDQVKKMRGRITRNASKLKNLLATTKKEVERIEKKVDSELEKVNADDAKSGGDIDVDLRDLNPKAVLALRKIKSGKFDSDSMDDMDAMEVLGDLQQYGLIDGSDKITTKGEQALANLRSSQKDARSTGDRARQARQDREELADV